MSDITVDWTVGTGFAPLGDKLDTKQIFEALLKRFEKSDPQAPDWLWDNWQEFKQKSRQGVLAQSLGQGQLAVGLLILAENWPDKFAYQDIVDRVELAPIVGQLVKAVATDSTLNGKEPIPIDRLDKFQYDLFRDGVKRLENNTRQSLYEALEARIRAEYPNASDNSVSLWMVNIAKRMEEQNVVIPRWENADRAAITADFDVLIQNELAQESQQTPIEMQPQAEPEVAPLVPTEQIDPLSGQSTLDFKPVSQAEIKASTLDAEGLRRIALTTGDDPIALAQQLMQATDPKTGATKLGQEPRVGAGNMFTYPGERGSRRLTFTQAVNWLVDQPRNSNALLSVQKKMEAAGYLTAGQYAVGVTDQTTIDAWRNVIRASFLQKKEIDQFFGEQILGRQQMFKQLAEQQPQTAPDQFGFQANRLAEQVIGRSLNGAEVARLREQFITFGQQNLQAQATGQPSVTWQQDDQTAWLLNRIRGANVVEAQKMDEFAQTTALTLAATGRQSLRLPKMTDQEQRDVVSFAAKQGWTPERMIAHIFDVYGGR